MPSQYANMRLNGLILQPWSVPIVKTSLPPEILQTMIEISDQIIADKEAEPAGPTLAGQIENELKIEIWLKFFKNPTLIDVNDLDEIPPMSYELIDFEKYKNYFYYTST